MIDAQNVKMNVEFLTNLASTLEDAKPNGEGVIAISKELRDVMVNRMRSSARYMTELLNAWQD